MTDPQGLEGLLKMEGLVKMAQDLQKKLQDAQDQLGTLTATAASGGGLVTATVNGHHRVTELRIERDAIGEDTEILQDLVAAAVNMALEKVEGQIQQKMGQATGGMPLPFSIPGFGG